MSSAAFSRTLSTASRSSSRSLARPSQSLRRLRQCQLQKISANAIRSYANEPGNGPVAQRGRSFKGQLMESTAARIKKEREEHEKFAEQRRLRQGGGGSYGLMVIATTIAAGTGWWLGQMYHPELVDASSTIPLLSSFDPNHDTSPGNLQACWTDMVGIVGKEHVVTEDSELQSHAGSSWSSYPQLPGDVPFLVVKPATTEEVSRIMRVCHERKIPVTAYSGGTSLEGHFAATRGGICIDFGRMDNVITIRKEDLDCTVQPAVGWELLNEELAKQSLFFPPDPGPGAMIGGMIGTGCSGTNAYRYGTMKDWVLSLTVVLADGTIVKTRQRPRKSSAGYDLTRVFVGSEGTLGLVTEATLKVTSKPLNTSVAVCSFGSIRDAANAVFDTVSQGVPIAAIELLDDNQMACINDAGMTSKTWKVAPTLFFKFSGTPTSVKESIGIVQKLAKARGSKSFEFARNSDEADELWSARKEALWSVTAKMKEGDKVWTTDVAVPISKLPQIIEETKEDITKSGLFGTIVGHVGDGNFHSILVYNEKEQHGAAEDVVHRMVKRALKLEGTATGEHGVGIVKRDYLQHELSEETVALMRKLKKAFDPLCLLNCDKVVRVAKPKTGEIGEW